MDGVGTVLIWGAAVIGYFLPGIIAVERKHHQVYAIFALNTLLGWTVLGWIGALIWSLTAVRKEPD